MNPSLKKARRLLDAIVEKHGPVYLFALVRQSPSFDWWNVAISASWAHKGDFDLSRAMYRLFKRIVKPSENSRIERIMFVGPDEPLASQLFMWADGTRDGPPVHLVEGHFIDERTIEAYVLQAEDPRQAQKIRRRATA